MVDKKIKIEYDLASYILGIISIVVGIFVTPLAGLIFGIIGLVQSKKEKTALAKRAKTLNIIGIIVSIIVFVIILAISMYFSANGTTTSFPY